MATCKWTQSAFRAIGVKVYSSAVYCYAPDIAMAYWKASDSGDEKTVSILMEEFFAPIARLRDRGGGYAVSIVKAGVRLEGLDVGRVRSPLVEPLDEDVERLVEIIR